MSDYISKSALKKYFRDYKWEFALGSDFSKAIEMVDMQPTIDEKEIIRKPMERIISRYTELMPIQFNGFGKTLITVEDAINVVKEEGGIE